MRDASSTCLHTPLRPWQTLVCALALGLAMALGAKALVPAAWADDATDGANPAAEVVDTPGAGTADPADGVDPAAPGADPADPASPTDPANPADPQGQDVVLTVYTVDGKDTQKLLEATNPVIGQTDLKEADLTVTGQKTYTYQDLLKLSLGQPSPSSPYTYRTDSYPEGTTIYQTTKSVQLTDLLSDAGLLTSWDYGSAIAVGSPDFEGLNVFTYALLSVPNYWLPQMYGKVTAPGIGTADTVSHPIEEFTDMVEVPAVLMLDVFKMQLSDKGSETGSAIDNAPNKAYIQLDYPILAQGAQLGSANTVNLDRSRVIENAISIYVAAPEQKTYKDTQENQWYTPYVNAAAAQGLMTGYTDGNFGPYNSTTRADFVTVLYRDACSRDTTLEQTYGSTTDTAAFSQQASKFSDVQAGQYYSAAIAWAVDKGIVSGYGDTGAFGPFDPLTRAQAAKIIAEYCREQIIGISTYNEEAFNSTTDVAEVPSWARAYMAWCADCGIIQGVTLSNGQLALEPNDIVWRASIAKIMTVVTGSITSNQHMGTVPGLTFIKAQQLKAGWWSVEGTVGYYDAEGVAQTGWVTTDTRGQGMQRYFFDDAGALVQGRIINADEPGAGYRAYATAAGYVAVGKMYDEGGAIILADDKGELASEGWLLTADYDGSEQLYRVGKEGQAITGRFVVSGSKYYADPQTGWVLRSGSIELDGTWYKADDQGVLTESVDPEYQRAFEVASSYSSVTDYLLGVDCTNHQTVVCQRGDNGWELLYGWTCADGAPQSPTVRGEYTVTGKGESFNGALGGSPYTCRYYTQFYGDYLFHSVPYWQNTWDVQDDTLGESVSHGCVRLATENAKWIYDNIPYGTKVVIFD